MNSKLRNMIFFRKMGIVATMIFCSHNIFGQTTTSAYYEYEVECLGVELDGSQTLRIWGVDVTKKMRLNKLKRMLFELYCSKEYMVV